MNYKVYLVLLVVCYHTVLGSEVLADDDVSSTDDESLRRVRRGGLSMLRLGRGLQMLRLGKRGLPMLRLGRSASDSALSGEDIRYLLSLMRSDRQVPLPRYGKDLYLQYMLMDALQNGDAGAMTDDEAPQYGYRYEFDGRPERQIRPAPRPGFRTKRSVGAESDLSDNAYDMDKQEHVRIPPFPRFGKDLSDQDYASMETRVAPLMRYGKENDYDSMDSDFDEGYMDQTAEKRAMRMLRLGRGMRMLRLGKRPMYDEDNEAEKRALNLLRLGKRPFNMLRLGRAESGVDSEKRALRLLRLGKKSASSESL